MRKKPGRFARVLYKLPVYLYRYNLGWLMGRRFIVINHTGRRTGRAYQTVVEVAEYDAATETYFVASGYGQLADWYQNLQCHPTTTVQIGNRCFSVEVQVLSTEASGEAMVRYARRYPTAARNLARMLGHAVAGDEASYRALGRSEIPYTCYLSLLPFINTV
jgi:deazaflavin-dependent oxidoreductase (nitroreductase family)